MPAQFKSTNVLVNISPKNVLIQVFLMTVIIMFVPVSSSPSELVERS